jgi:hypothetical protein
MTTYATKVSAHYIARRQAAQAGGDPVNFLLGTVIVGDGNGAVPAISALVAAGGVLHEVWRGQVVVAVAVNAQNPAQLDIRVVIPAAIGGVEVGPFWVREFVITDELGQPCVYGVTSLEKTTSAQGQISELSWIAAIGESDSSVVILSPPSADFVTGVDMQAAINAHQPTADEPIYVQDTTTGGWLSRVFKIRRAAQGQIGVERPATDAEFAAGAPAGGASPWPWPTLQQVKTAIKTYLSGEGVAVAGDYKVNLNFPGLADAPPPTGADLMALFDTEAGHHRKFTWASFLGWLETSLSGSFVGLQVYDDTASYAPLPGASKGIALLTGGGGAGGSSNGGASLVGGGGESGATSIKALSDLQALAGAPIVIGAGGAPSPADAASGSAAGSGGDSSFAGMIAKGGQGGLNSVVYGASLTPTTGSVGDVVIEGNPGEGPAGAAYGGFGGASFWGGRGVGGEGSAGVGAAPGGDATGAGSGGGGGDSGVIAAVQGGAGRKGRLVIIAFR